MFIDFDKAMFPKKEDIEKHYKKIIAIARKNKSCTVCIHRKVLEDYELCHKTCISVCEITGKPTASEMTCSNYKYALD